MTKPAANYPTSGEEGAPAPQKRTTITQNLIIGSGAGAIEVLVDHPLWSIKTRMQCGYSFTLNPRLLYLGIIPNVASMTPITGIQVGLDCWFQHAFFKDRKELSCVERIGSAFVAGMGSSFASCPTELVMTAQKKTGSGFCMAGDYLVSNHGWRSLFRGLPATMMREGIFTAFFLAGTPMIKAIAQPYFAKDYTASLIAGMGSGFCATIVSQSADTLKTIQQAADPQSPLSLRGAAKTLYENKGLFGFFKGGIPRGARVMSAVTIMGFLTEKMEAFFLASGVDDSHRAGASNSSMK